jgi:ribosomal protein S13
VWKASGKIYSLNWLLYGVGKKFNEDLIASDDIHKDQIIKNLKEEIDTKNTYIRTLEGYVEALKDKNDYLQRELTAKNTVSSGKEKSPKMGTLFANVVE